MPFQATFDMACEGVANIWEAHGLISAEAELETEDILSVRYTGESNYNGWPTLSIVFANTNAAKVYTAVWMGMDISQWDVYTDEDVNDYLAHGSFVRGWCRIGPVRQPSTKTPIHHFSTVWSHYLTQPPTSCRWSTKSTVPSLLPNWLTLSG